MESSHFLAISSPWQKLQNIVLRILICCHNNEIWAIFAKISNCFFFFVSRWNRAILGMSFLHVAFYKTLFFDFWFRPFNPQNWLPKIRPKIAYNSACMADIPEMFSPNRGFSGMADSMEPYKMLRGRTLLPWQRKFGKFGILFHKNRFFFCFSTESSDFLAISSPYVALYKTLFFDFWFRPPNAKNLLPKICTCTKSLITRLVWQTDRRCLRLLGGF